MCSSNAPCTCSCCSSDARSARRRAAKMRAAMVAPAADDYLRSGTDARIEAVNSGAVHLSQAVHDTNPRVRRAANERLQEREAQVVAGAEPADMAELRLMTPETIELVRERRRGDLPPGAPVGGVDYPLTADPEFEHMRTYFAALGEERRDGRLASEMARTGMAEAELRDATKAELRRIAAEGQVRVQVPHWALEGVLDKGLLSVFETGTSMGQSRAYQRHVIEHEVMGVPLDAAPEDHRRYGYLHHSDTDWGDSGSYGDIELVLHDDVKSLSTFTVGDSLDACGSLVPTSFNDPSPDAAYPRAGFRWQETGLQRADYAEVQIAGSVTRADISAIRGPRSVRQQVEAAGIRWELWEVN